MGDELDNYIREAAGIKTNKTKDNPQARAKILEAVRAAKNYGYDIPNEVAEDFYNLTSLESGRSHYLADGKTVKLGTPTRDGDRAIGFSQVMGNTAKPYKTKGLDPYKETDNIIIGLNEFYNGDKSDSIARRLAYVGGPDSAALREYRRTGKVSDAKLYSYLPNNKETYKSYVENSGGFNTLDQYIKTGAGSGQKSSVAGVDDYIKQTVTGLSSEETPNQSQPVANQDAELQGYQDYVKTLPKTQMPQNFEDWKRQNAQAVTPTVSTVDNPSPDANNWQSQYAKPDWQNNLTKLSPAEEKRFQAWAKQNRAPVTDDYDMRGFWKALEAKDPRAVTAINQTDGKLHFPDTWKTPLHKSFSGESIYANEDAPRWNDKDQLVDKNGSVVFDENPSALKPNSTLSPQEENDVNLLSQTREVFPPDYREDFSKSLDQKGIANQAAIEQQFKQYLQARGLDKPTPEAINDFNNIQRMTADSANRENQKAPQNVPSLEPQSEQNQPAPLEQPQTEQFSDFRQDLNYSGEKNESSFKDFVRKETERVLLEKVPGATGADVDAVFSTSGFDNKYNPANQRTTITVSKGLQNAVARERDNRIATKKAVIANYIASGADLTSLPYDELEKQGINFNDVVNTFQSSDPIISQAKEKREVVASAKNEIERINALLQTKQISNLEAYDMIAAERAAREKLQAELDNQLPLYDEGQSALGVYGYSKPKNVDQYLKSEGIFSAKDFLDQQERDRIENLKSWKRIAENPNTAAAEFTKNLTRSLPNAIAALSKTVSIGSELIDYALGNKALDTREAKDRGFYQLGKWIERKTDEFLPQDAELRRNFLVTTLPDTLGQLLVQIGVGALTGGVGAPLLVGASQGAVQQYEDADKFNASRGQKLLSAVVGGLAAVPDAIPLAKWLKPLTNIERAGFFTRLVNSIFGKAAEEVGEKEAESVVKQFLKNAWKGGLFEGTQEVSENKIDDTLASLTYDPKRKIFTINDNDIESFLGGVVGGVFGGGVETVLERNASSEEIDEKIKEQAENKISENGAAIQEVKETQPVQNRESVIDQLKPEISNNLTENEKKYLSAFKNSDDKLTSNEILDRSGLEQSDMFIAGSDLQDKNILDNEGEPDDGTSRRFIKPENFAPQKSLSPQQSLDAVNAALPEKESDFTVQKQIESLLNPDSPRAAVLLTEQNQIALLPEESEDLHAVKTKEGVLVISEAKAKSLGLDSPEEIENYVRQNGYSKLLGKVEDLTHNTADGLVAVRTLDKDGNELTTSVVNNPENVQKQKDLDAAQFPDEKGLTQQVTTVEDAVEKRREQAETPAQNVLPAAERINRMQVAKAKTPAEKSLEKLQQMKPAKPGERVNRFAVEKSNTEEAPEISQNSSVEETPKTKVQPAQSNEAEKNPAEKDDLGFKTFFGGMGGDMGESLRKMLWAKVEKGDTTEAGGPSNLLIGAKAVRDRGGLQTRAEFDKFAVDFTKAVDGKKGADLKSAAQSVMRAYLPSNKTNLSRNYRAGTNDATITFDSETQRDLFDYYANEKKSMQGGGQKANQTRVKDLSALKTDLAQRLGVNENEVFGISSLVSEDVKNQMKGVAHLEERAVSDNVTKSSDRKNGRYQETKIVKPQAEAVEADGFVNQRPVKILDEQNGKYKIQYLDGKKETPTVLKSEFSKEQIKEPYEMTRDEFVASEVEKEFSPVVQNSTARIMPAYHRKAVEKALKEGKTVPAEVLKDYPELAENPAQITTPEASEKPANDDSKSSGDSPFHIIGLGDLQPTGKTRVTSGKTEIEVTDEGGVNHFVPENFAELARRDDEIDSELEQLAADAENVTNKLKRVKPSSEKQSQLLEQSSALTEKRKALQNEQSEIRKQINGSDFGKYVEDYRTSPIEKNESPSTKPLKSTSSGQFFEPETLDADHIFGKVVEKILDGKIPQNGTVSLGVAPKILRALGFDRKVIALPSENVFKAIDNLKHFVKLSTINQLPSLLANPVMVFESDTVKNAIVVVLDAVDRRGFPVMVAIHLNRTEGRANVHRIASIYGRENLKSFENWINDDLLLYYHKQKMPAWNTTHKLQLPRVVQTKQATSIIETNETIVKKPLKKVKSETDENLLNTVLPSADMETVVPGIASSFKSDNLEINEFASEIIRRLAAEKHYRETGIETDELPFDAITFHADYIRELTALGREFAPEFENAGYSEEDLKGFSELLGNLDRLADTAEDFGVAYVFDEALPEEMIHQEDLRAGRTDLEALSKLEKSPFWEAGEKFGRDYANISDADKASEIAAKLATDQAEKYGWDKVENFEAEKEKFLTEWADGIVRRNQKEIESNGIDAFVKKFERISKYADFTKIDAGRVGAARAETNGDESAVESDQGIGDAAEPQETAEKPETNQPLPGHEKETADGQIKPRQTVLSAEETGAVEKGKLTGEARYYQVKSRDANSRRAQEMIEKDGLEKAVWNATNPPVKISPEFTAYQMETISLLNNQADAAVKENNPVLAQAKLDTAQEIVAAMAEKATEMGQAISQLAQWQKTDPNAVTGYVQKRRNQKGIKEALTPEEARTLRESAENLQKANAEIENLQKKIDELEEKLSAADKAKNKLTNAVRKEVKSRADSALERLKQTFELPALKSVSLSEFETKKLSPEQLKDFAAVGASLLHEKTGAPMTLKEFYNEMVKMFGKDIRPHLPEIHASAETELKNIRREIYRQRRIETLQAIEGNEHLTTDDLNKIVDDELQARKENARIRGERQRAANKVLKEQENLNELDELPSFAKSLFKIANAENKEVLLGALLLETKQVSSPDELARALKKQFPDLSSKAALNTASLAARARQQAHEDLRAEKAALNKEKAQSAAEKTEAVKQRNDAQRKLLNRIKFLENEPPSYAQRIGRIYKAALVSAVQTTTNNFLMAEATRKIETLTDLTEIAINRLLNKVGVKLRDDAIKPETPIADILGYMSTEDNILAAIGQKAKDAVFARGIANSVLDEFPTFYESLFGSYASDIAVMREGTDRKSVPDTLMHGVETVYEYANFLNYFQEFLVRSQEFNRALQMRLGAKGLKLKELVEDGKVTDIADDDLKFAVERALRVTFAKSPEKNTVSDKLLNLYLKHVPALLAPFGITFPKFLYNSTSFITDYAPLIGLAKAGYVNKKQNNTGYIKGLASLTTRQASYQLIGTTLFLAALGMVRGFGDDDKWYYLRLPGSKYYIDVRGYQPFAAIIFMANKFNRLVTNKPVFSDEDTAWSETMEAMTGLSTRNLTENKPVQIATGLAKAVGNSIGAYNSKDERDWDRVTYLFKQQMGEIVGGFIRPLKTVKDLVAEFDSYESKIPDTTDAPFTAGVARSLPFSNRLLGLETKKNFVTGKEMEAPAPALKILGVSVVNPDLHKEVPTKALVLLRELNDNFKREKEILPEAQKKAQVKSDIYRAMREAGDDPEKLEKVNAAIERAEKAGILEPKEIEPIERQKGMSEFKNLSQKLDYEKLGQVWKISSDRERESLRSIVESKAESANKRRDLSEKDVEAIKKYLPEFSIKLKPPMTIFEKVKSSTTDEAVELYFEKEKSLSDEQKKEFKEYLQKKAENANQRGTLTDEEIEQIKRVIPEFKVLKNLPSNFEKMPSGYKKSYDSLKEKF
jgi:hypothetical protein